MDTFYYVAVDKKGRRHKGKIEMSARDKVRDYLAIQDLTPIRIEKLNFLTKDIRFSPVRKFDIAMLFSEMSMMMNAGLYINDVIEITRKHIQNKRLKQIMENVSYSVQKGESFSKALGAYKEIPLFVAKTVYVGEQSDNLPAILERISEHYEQEYLLEEKIKSSLTYPVLLTVCMTVVIFFAIIYLLPNYASLFNEMGGELPAFTRVFMNISVFLSENHVYFFIGFCVAVGICCALTRMPKGKYWVGKIKMRMPVLGKLNRLALSNQFCFSLSMLLSASVPVSDALETIQSIIENEAAKKGLAESVSLISQGMSLSDALDKLPFTDDYFYSVVSAAQNADSLHKAMPEAAKYYRAALQRYANRVCGLIGPASLIIAGACIGLVMAAILLPTAYITNYI